MKQFQRKIIHQALFGATGAVLLLASGQAAASCTSVTVTGNTTVSTTTTNCYTADGITSAPTITVTGSGVVNNTPTAGTASAPINGITIDNATGNTTIGAISNAGTIKGDYGIDTNLLSHANTTTIASITNTGTISGTGVANNAFGIGLHYNTVITGDINNSGSITAPATGGVGIGLWGTPSTGNTGVVVNGSIINSGTVSAGAYGIAMWPANVQGGIVNTGTINGTTDGILAGGATTTISNGITNAAGSTISGGTYGVTIQGGATVSGGINNSGVISGGTASVLITGSGTSVDAITVTGNDTAQFTNGSGGAGTVDAVNTPMSVASGATYSIINSNHYIVPSFTNNGTMNFGAGNTATVTGNFVNQGVFNVGVNSTTSYGKLVVNGTGSTATLNNGSFGIMSSSNLVVLNTYAGVITTTGGIDSAYTTKTGVFTKNGISYNYSFLQNGNNIDLYIPSIAAPIGTQASVQNNVAPLQSNFKIQNTALANGLNYDCTYFDVNNVCVSGGARYTGVSASSGLTDFSALAIAAYRPDPNFRVGAFIDQNLSMSNAGGTVSMKNNLPLMGLFAAWKQNQDDTGAEVKVSAAYGQKYATVTRSVVANSEPGSGTAPLTSQGAQLVAKYGFGVAEDTVVAPYVGLRYSQNNMGGYTEGTSASVVNPLTYNALNTNATTALAGVGASYTGIAKTKLFGTAGVEYDTNTQNGTYTATGAYNMTGLSSINFNPNPVSTRPTASLGAQYNVQKNQRIGLTGIYRQESYQASSSATAILTYTVDM